MDTSFLEYDDLNYSFHFFKSKTNSKNSQHFELSQKHQPWIRRDLRFIYVLYDITVWITTDVETNCGNWDLEVLTSIMRKELWFEHKEKWVNLRNLVGKNYIKTEARKLGKQVCFCQQQQQKRESRVLY